MQKKPNAPAMKAADLRRRAEEQLRIHGNAPLSDADRARLVHELQVHQIELEMQNEELQQANDRTETLLAQYTDLYDFAPAGYMTLDRAGTIRQVNLTGVRLLGVARSRLVNRRLGLLVAEASRPAFNDFLERVFAGTAQATCEVPLPQKGQCFRFVRLEGVRSANGQTCRAVMMDITDRKRTEASLHASEARYRAVVEDQTEIISRFRGDGTFTFVNEAYCRFFGKPAEELLGRKWQPVAVPDDLPHIEEQLRSLSPSNPVVVIENRVYAGDGQVHWMQFVNRGLFDERGRLSEIQSVGRDITEHRRVEQSLQQSQATLKLAVAAADVGLWDWTLNSDTIQYSPEWKRQIGYGDAGISNRLDEWQSRLHPDDLEPTLQKVRACISNPKGRYAVEFRLRHKDGSYRWIYSHGAVLRNDAGTPLRMLGCHIDITERKQVETALRALSRHVLKAEDKERRRIAKELHDSTAQDLVAVMMDLDSVRESLARRAAPEASLVEDGLAVLEKCVNDIRTLSYLLHPPYLVESGLVSAIRHYASGFGERTGIAMTLDLPDNMERLDEDTELALFRVMQESLGNIHRHAHSPTATIRLARDAAELVLEICDTGCGMPSAVANAMEGSGVGMGVGIAGMRDRLLHIGGRLEIKSGSRGTVVRAILRENSRSQKQE